MKCCGCRRDLEVGDQYIKAPASEFTRQEDGGFDDLIADIMGGHGGEIVYCEDCTQRGGDFMLHTVYGDEEDE